MANGLLTHRAAQQGSRKGVSRKREQYILTDIRELPLLPGYPQVHARDGLHWNFNRFSQLPRVRDDCRPPYLIAFAASTHDAILQNRVESRAVLGDLIQKVLLSTAWLSSTTREREMACSQSGLYLTILDLYERWPAPSY